MFTGLVTACSPVLGVEPVLGSLRIRANNPYGELAVGESIAVNGVCLTVERPDLREGGLGDSSQMSFFVSPETLRRTTLGGLEPGSLLNLERALQASDRLGGHVVQGHVDGVGKIAAIEQDGDAWRLEVEIPGALSRYCVSKGSICLDGVSLTINEILPPGDKIWIQLIPHTFNATRFRQSCVGMGINVEVDVVAKYVERLCQPYLKH
ncbi:MAG: riboflavin synthase [Oligoflexia bacterium]|jgi:riboflavin synthase